MFRLNTAVDYCELIDGFALPRFFSETHGIPDEDFFDEFNFLMANHVSFGSEIWMHVEHNNVLRRKSNSLYDRVIDQSEEEDAEVESLRAKVSCLEIEISFTKPTSDLRLVDVSVLISENL